MQKLMSSLLIPLLLVSQSLSFAPHSHAGTSVAEPHGHDVRPHFHVGHGHHHHHSADDHHDAHDGQRAPEVPADHDSDAVYANDVHLITAGKVLKIASPGFASWIARIDRACSVKCANASVRLCGELTLWPFQRPNCALYVRHLSLLC